MYKAQLVLQKILCFAAIVVCGVAFLYSLGLMTDLYDGLYWTIPNAAKLDSTRVPGSQVYYYMQDFNKALLNSSIGLLLAACLLFITSTHSRRRYYIGNAVSTFLFAGAGTAMSVWTHLEVESYKAQFLQIDFETYLKQAERRRQTYIDSTFWFDVHYVVCALILIVCVLLVANYFWKLHLMRAEKRLIEQGKEALA
ncbi:MAG: hypothetical protein IJB81_04015 [Clostridia bacterium]|nr:hypothetical protein [Clostridia bacterium]